MQQPGFRDGAFVRFVGGPFTGRVGQVVLMGTPDGLSLALVAVSRPSSPGQHGHSPGTVPIISEVWVHPFDLAEVC